MRQPTDQEKKTYKYMVSFVIDVKRTDGALLTDDENLMVQDMKTATEQVITKVMKIHGNNNSKSLGSEMRKY